MKIDFLATGNRFLPFSQTAMDCYRGEQFFLQVEHLFQLIVISGSFLSAGNSIALFRTFFLPMETIIEIRDKPIFKDEPYSC